MSGIHVCFLWGGGGGWGVEEVGQFKSKLNMSEAEQTEE